MRRRIGPDPRCNRLSVRVSPPKMEVCRARSVSFDPPDPFTSVHPTHRQCIQKRRANIETTDPRCCDNVQRSIIATMELPNWDSQAPLPRQDNDSNRSANAGRTLQKLSLDNYTTVICFLEEFGVLVCKEHCTAVVNLDVHLRDQHATPAAVRKQILQQLSNFTITAPGEVELPEQPAWPIKELGTPRKGFKCKTCEFITVSTDAIRKHCKKRHQQPWTSEKIELFHSVKVQTFFCSGGLQKYFIVQSGVAENRQDLDQNHVVEEQLSTWHDVRKQLEEDIDIMGDAAKTDKTGWFKRAGWLEFFKDRNLVHLAHQARLPDRNEVKLQTAAQLTERLIEKCVKGLATLPQETRRWLRSAQQTDIDQRPLARLQNPESQATYAGYMVRFVCFYLRVVADEER
jgi:hypothetical protein